MTTTPRTYALVGTATDRFIRRLQQGYRQDRPAAVATLARLRRGAGRSAHDVPDLWGLTSTAELAVLLADLPAAEQRAFDHDRAEEALHLAVTLWASHQQSHREADMHVVGNSLGRAVRVLMAPDTLRSQTAAETRPGVQDAIVKAEPELNEPLRRRFVRVGTASSLEAMTQRLREIVQLLRREGLGLDYALLADQVHRWQLPAYRAEVRREWGREFHLADAARG
ncbi:type I-E CRISPR-associated protein Cse2/CasB [Streptomyces sp. NBC_01476]|uniref:type I-E CRISPR-associated protein Cse2/CasB n=1 Tax=Streptomyces sp. NBC_01476 TaxID=2903881 RepID=UPI002E322BA0|nr:type I-E CRISPR-associated protein Cse2/CasB [Streptomyces sp. NBC_01476]